MALSARRPIGVLRHWFAVGPLRRVYRNAGVLLSGRTAAGLLGLGALALATRVLGAETFGVLVLIHAYALAIGNLATFKAWQSVIRYGSLCLQDDRRADLQALLCFTTLLDLGSAVVGVAVAVALAPAAASVLGWPAEAVALAMVYSVTILFTLKSTPVGVLRLFDRFDLLAAHEAVAPAVRLLGAAAAYALGAGLGGFVAVWLAAGVAEGVVLWALGVRELARRGLLAGIVGWPRGAARVHPGLWGFVWTTNLNASLGQVRRRLAPLIVGWVLGPAPAGLFHVAQRVSAILARPAQLLRQSAYPELAKLVARNELKAVKRLVLRAGLVAAAGGLPVLLVLGALGAPILELVGGPEFTAAYGLLVLLGLARLIHLLGFPLGSALVALGRPGLALRVNLVIAVLFVPTLIGLLHAFGLIGAGLNTVAFALMTVGVMGAMVLRLLSRRGRAAMRDAAAPAAAGAAAAGQPARAEAEGSLASGASAQYRARNG